MNPPPPASSKRGGRGPFPPVEAFMCFLCLLMPGVTAGTLLTAWRFWSFGSELGLALTISIFVVMLFGCCAFAGWISAATVAEDRKTKEAIKSAFLMLLLQVMVTPVLGGFTGVVFEAAF